MKATLKVVEFWYINKPKSKTVFFAPDYQFTKIKSLSLVF